MSNARGTRRSVHGFTLIEVLVVVAIIALLISILLPSLQKARDQAKEVLCGTQLSQFGRGFYAYATANKDYLCSGSFDPGRVAIPLAPVDPRQNPFPTSPTSDHRDGPVHKIGWVADMVNSKTARPGDMLCPTNPAKYNQKLGRGSSSGAYSAAQAAILISLGYNTNYTQSWYMARTECTSIAFPNMKDVRGKVGPLRTSRMLKVSPSRVPLLGDSTLESSDKYNGQITCRTMTNGPFSGPYDNQDYSDFGPQHGFGQTIQMPTGTGLTETNRVRANVMMGDGHIERFIDKVRDGRFGYQQDPANNMVIQDDVEASRVFDGIITLGRHSGDAWSMQ